MNTSGRARNTYLLFTILVVVVSALVLYGWAAGADILVSISPFLPSMKIVSAISFLIIAAGMQFLFAVELEGRKTERVMLGAAGAALWVFLAFFLWRNAIDTTTLTHSYFSLDERGAFQTLRPGLPSTITIINFFLVGLLFIARSIRLGSFKHLFAVGATLALFGVTALVGMIAHVPFLYYAIPGLSTGMALPSAMLFILMGLALLTLGNEVHRTLIACLMRDKAGKKTGDI